jgi:AhpD family alkylhydroperoxidase
MSPITIVDRPLCCSSGVCGPDPELERFASDLSWLESQGVAVERINPSADPEAFLGQSALMALFQEHGNACLPAFLVGGRVVSSGSYLGRDELAGLAGVASPAADVLEPRVRELVAIGAAIAANCEPCFRHHFAEARKLGCTREEMAQAVGVAQAVKDSPAAAILELAEKYLKEEPAAETASACGCRSAAEPSPGDGSAPPSTPSGCCC